MNAKKFLVVLVAVSFIFQPFSFTAFAGGGAANDPVHYYPPSPSDLPALPVPPDYINFSPSNYSFIPDQTTIKTDQWNGQTYQSFVIRNGHATNSITGAVVPYQSKQFAKRFPGIQGRSAYVFELDAFIMSVNGQRTIKMEVRESSGIYGIDLNVTQNAYTTRVRGTEAQNIINVINMIKPELDNLSAYWYQLRDMTNISTFTDWKANANQIPLNYQVLYMQQISDYHQQMGPNSRQWNQGPQLVVNGVQLRIATPNPGGNDNTSFPIKSIQNVAGYDVFYGAAYGPDGFTSKGYGIVFKKGAEEAVADYPNVKEIWLNGGLYNINIGINDIGSVQITPGVAPTGSH